MLLFGAVQLINLTESFIKYLTESFIKYHYRKSGCSIFKRDMLACTLYNYHL